MSSLRDVKLSLGSSSRKESFENWLVNWVPLQSIGLARRIIQWQPLLSRKLQTILSR